VSNEGRNKLIDNESGGGKNPLEAMRTTLSSMSCPNVYSVKDRLYSAIEQLIIEISDQEDEEVHANIMFFVLSKRNDEKGYEFHDENDEVPSPKLDLLAVLYKTMRSIRTSNIAYVYQQI
jgi:3-deoxy-D-manno-octulosonic-acid transferase